MTKSKPRYLNFTGECRWAKLTKPDEKYGHFSIDVHLSEEDRLKYKAAGCQGRILDDGFVTFKRRNKILTMKQEVMEFGPPKVSFANEADSNKLIGNGSTVTVSVCVYDTTKGPGTRLDSVVVNNLVEYKPKENNTQNETSTTTNKVNVPF